MRIPSGVLQGNRSEGSKGGAMGAELRRNLNLFLGLAVAFLFTCNVALGQVMGWDRIPGSTQQGALPSSTVVLIGDFPGLPGQNLSSWELISPFSGLGSAHPLFRNGVQATNLRIGYGPTLSNLTEVAVQQTFIHPGFVPGAPLASNGPDQVVLNLTSPITAVPFSQLYQGPPITVGMTFEYQSWGTLIPYPGGTPTITGDRYFLTNRIDFLENDGSPKLIYTLSDAVGGPFTEFEGTASPGGSSAGLKFVNGLGEKEIFAVNSYDILSGIGTGASIVDVSFVQSHYVPAPEPGSLLLCGIPAVVVYGYRRFRSGSKVSG